MIKAKYKTIAELKQAIDAGEVSKDVEVVLDNDCASVYLIVDEDDIEYLWHGDGPYDAAEQALDALDIKWRHV